MMTAIRRVALLTTIVAFTIPALVSGQQPSTDSLLRRIELLERRTADLEQRVRQLESLIKAEPSRDRSLPASANWRDVQNWRRLRRGMSMDDVRALLGEPERVQAGVYTYWFWDNPSAHALFDNDGKLDGWSEPRR